MVDKTIGRNRNSTDEVDTTIIAINSVTATKIADANDDRSYFSAVLLPSAGDVDIHIRYYAAVVDNIKQGAEILTRHTMGNLNLFHPVHIMQQDNIYTGEISAIADVGTFDLSVTEG